MTDRTSQHRGRVSLRDDRAQPKARDLNLANRAPVDIERAGAIDGGGPNAAPW
jgi:hypothetical protein